MITMPIKLKKVGQAGLGAIELIIVLSIIAVLVYFAYYYYQDISKRTHDATRLADMSNLRQAIELTTHDSGDKLNYLLCSSVRIPCEGLSFPYSYENSRIDGKGWLKVNIKNQSLVHFNFLPSDPVNNHEYHYEYFSDGLSWKLTAKLESKEYKNKMREDGGEDPEKYEIIVKVDQEKIQRNL